MLNLQALWQQKLWKKLFFIFFIISHLGFLAFTWFEHSTPALERIHPSTSNIGVLVYHADFYLHWSIVLLLFVFFLFCTKQLFLKIKKPFGIFILCYFMIYFSLFIGSIIGISFSTFYVLLMQNLEQEKS